MERRSQHRQMNPYDLNEIGAYRERERGIKRVAREAANEEVRRRIARIKSFGGQIYGTDLDQMADILDPLNKLDRPTF